MAAIRQNLYKDESDRIYSYTDNEVEHGFVKRGLTPIAEEQAKAIIESRKPLSTAESVRAERDVKIAAVMWRYDRNARETRLGLFVQDDIAALDAYVQSLADVPEQEGFPVTVVWPTEP